MSQQGPMKLASRYRPLQFDDIVDQQAAAGDLKHAVANDMVAAVYLFCGPQGIGKTTLARVLAMALNCAERGEDGEPCARCENCTRIAQGKDTMDVVEIDAASNRGVDDARELRERMMYAPSDERRHKVYILDEAHMMTREAWNSLLKILEEMPPRVHVVLATTEPQKIEATAPPILSRCQRFDLRRVSVQGVVANLKDVAAKEEIEVSDEAIFQIANHNRGGMRDALNSFEKVITKSRGNAIDVDTVRAVLGVQPEMVYLKALKALSDKNKARAAACAITDWVRDQGIDYHRFLLDLSQAFGALSSVMVGHKPSGWTESGQKALAALGKTLDPAAVVECQWLALQMEPMLKSSDDPKVVLDVYCQKAITVLAPKEA